MNYILNDTDKMEFHTDLRVIFNAFKNTQLKYNWLVTDLDCNFIPEALQDRICFSGEELTNIINKYDIQFIWAVLSGFLPEENINVNNLDVIPYADGNPEFWGSQPSIQHPKAKVEIICWDGTYTLLLSKDEEIAKNFNDFFPEAEILEDFNNKMSGNTRLLTYENECDRDPAVEKMLKSFFANLKYPKKN